MKGAEVFDAFGMNLPKHVCVTGGGAAADKDRNVGSGQPSKLFQFS